MEKKNMYYNFLKVTDFDCDAILQQMKKLAANRADFSMDLEAILKMIIFMMPRKEEKLYQQINSRNIARHFVSFIPIEPFEEIEKKADLNDPVRINIFSGYFLFN